MRLTYLAVIAAGTLCFYSCDQKNESESNAVTMDSTKQEEHADMTGDTAAAVQKANIKIMPLKGSVEFQDASLQLNEPAQDVVVPAGEVKFKYEVKNYQLKTQTPRSNCNECNNSKDGQHIHLILNNEPYIAIYEPEYKTNLKEGHYVALSFLSRSYHESIKQYQAYDLRQFTVGKKKEMPVDLTQPLLFYSRPKGDYEGEFTKKVLLDFYLVNTDLAANGNKVKATINGNEFILDKWQPYIIEGLPMGESTVKLELINKDGVVINPKMNTIERKFNLKEKKVS